MYRLHLLLLAITSVFCDIDDPHPSILDGRIAQLGQFPYMASLRRTGSLFHIGGGALISDQWIITAATVTQPFTIPNDLSVALGILNTANTVIPPGILSVALAIVQHPQFSFSGSFPVNNLALVRIPAINCQTIGFGIISPIFMDPTFIRASNMVVAGWGPTEESKEPNTLLRFREDHMHIYCTDAPSNTACSNPMLCTTDIGSPAVGFSGLIGIASFGHCNANFEDMYTPISPHRSWIAAVTGI